jgi:hypothetical protein
VAELADALDSKSSDRKIVWVRAPPPALAQCKKLARCRKKSHNLNMIIPARTIALAVVGFALAAGNSWALALQGIVRDAAGRPLKDAEIRIEGREGSEPRTARTDGKGRYRSTGLGEGTFNVSLVVNGAVKAAIANVRVWEGDPEQQLNFEMKTGRVMPNARGKHYVWVKETTGTHLGGRWVEVDNKPATFSSGQQQRMDSSGGDMVKKIQDYGGTAVRP